MAKNAQVIREEINAKIMESLAKGKIPWMRPWKVVHRPGNLVHHHNFVSKRAYRGVNPFILEMTAQSEGWESTAWGTFHQWSLLDCQIKKGEKSTWIVLWKKLQAPVADGEEDVKGKSWFILRYFNVFNACQVVGKTATAEKFLQRYRATAGEEEEAAVPVSLDYAIAEKIVHAAKHNGLKITHGGNQASWKNGTDNVRMPKVEQFPSLSHYYETLFHEMSHWTEQAKFTNWDRLNLGYGMGELRAEISSCYLTEHCGIPHGEDLTNHTAYIQGWLEKMKEDPKWFFKAVRFADEAADCILKMAGMSDKPEQPEEETKKAA